MKPPKISIIICSIEARKYARVCTCYTRLMANHPFEIIGIHDAKSLAEAYNRGIRQATGDILIFSHDDILILDDDFAAKIVASLADFDILGFAGTSKVINGIWFAADQPHIHGVISHAKPGNPQLSINIFGVGQWPVVEGIQAIDGVCMIARRAVAEKIGFDEIRFDGFHLYDMDFSYSAYLSGYRLGVCCDIPLIHDSSGSFRSQDHSQYEQRFLEKHAGQIAMLNPGAPPTVNIDHKKGRGALFDDCDALLRAWQRDILQRATVAMRRPSAPQ